MNFSSNVKYGMFLFLLGAGCASIEPPADLVSYEAQVSNQTLVERVKPLAPKEYSTSEAYHQKAVAACNDEDQELCQHYASLAKISFETACEKAATAGAEGKHKELIAGVDAAQKDISLEKARQQDYERRIARVERVKQLELDVKNATNTAEAEKARMSLELEKQALAGKEQGDRIASQQAALDVLLERNALLEDAAAIVGNDNVKQIPTGIIVTVRDLFDARKTAVRQDKLPLSELVAQLAVRYPAYPVVIEGHTDSQGPETGNLALSQARAQAVMDQFLSEKVNIERVKAVGYGESKPISDNQNSTGRAINRRIDVKFLFTKDVPKAQDAAAKSAKSGS